MNRAFPVVLAAILFAISGPEIAGAASPPPRVVRLDGRSGLVAGNPQAAASNVSAIQAAIDGLQASLSQGGTYSTRVVLPEGDYYVDRPIFLDGSRVGLEGAGRGITRLLASGGHDILVTGVARKPGAPGNVPGLTADHFVDLHGAGWLKGVTTATGQRWAFRTKADAHLAQQGGPLDTFPAGVKALTVELALDLSRLDDAGGSHRAANTASVLGLTDRGVPSPWDIVIGGRGFILRLRSDSGKTAEVSWGAIPDRPGFLRLTAQVDLAAGEVSTWVNDRRVPNNAKLPADFRAFAANQHCPFGIGSNALTANAVADQFGGASDIAFAGLRVSAAPIYKAADVLARRDGKTVDDGRYFRAEPSTLGFLPLTGRPAEVRQSRVMTVVGPGATPTTAYCLSNEAHLSNYATSAPGPIRHLSLIASRPYGRGLAVGYAVGLHVEDCEILGGRDGLASINFGSSYPVTIVDCDLAGADSPLYLFMVSSARVDRISLPREFRCGIRLVYANATIRNVFAPCWGESDHYVRSVASSFVLQDSSFDHEGPGGARVAPIYCLPGSDYPTICRVSRCNFASYGKAAPLALLDELAAPDKLPLRFTVEDCPDVIRGGMGSGRIDVRGDRWKVSKDW